MTFITKFLRWWNHSDLQEAYDKVIADNQAFMNSLDERQLKYYLSLGTSWYKALTALETRIYNLENKKD